MAREECRTSFNFLGDGLEENPPGQLQPASGGLQSPETCSAAEAYEAVVDPWVNELYRTEMACMLGKFERAAAHGDKGKLKKEALPLAVAAKVESMQRKVLTAVGLKRCGDPPFDQFAQQLLEDARYWAASITDEDVKTQLGQHHGTGGGHYKKVSAMSSAAQREDLAWQTAQTLARDRLMRAALIGITREELDEEIAHQASQARADETTFTSSPVNNQMDIVVDGEKKRIPSGKFFDTKVVSPLSLRGWCELPARPIVMPGSKPECGPQGLASFLFDRIIYAPQVCDRKGRQVGLSEEARQAYIDKVTYAVERNESIIASEYVPLVAIGNPIKRNTQGVGLAEVDFFRRLTEISRAVELYYEPGMRWLIGNEAPAFQGPEFHLPEGYVQQFHADCEAIAQRIDPKGQRLELFNLANVLWDTDEHKAQWVAYEQVKVAALREAYSHSNHPEHEDVVRYMRTFTYPMTTCINPYHFDSAEGLSSGDVAEVYAALKTSLNSNIRGVGASAGHEISVEDLSSQQKALLQDLQQWGHEITFKYRTVMDSRAVLPAFDNVIPQHTLAHTIVTKRDKLVLYPNSGRGAYFPAHGEPVLLPAQDSGQRSAVTVRPWWQIASNAAQYEPVYLNDGNEPFYFQERSR
jgi:hypothetical protein